MALTMGMTISPKIEIYYQLICRVMGPEESGTTLPPPTIDTGLSPQLPRLSNSSRLEYESFGAGENSVDRFVRQATISARGLPGFRFEVMPSEGDSWAKQCHKSHNVQKAVSSLVSRFP